MILLPPLSLGILQVALRPTWAVKLRTAPGLLGAVSVVPDTVLVQVPVPTLLTAAT